MKPEPVTPAAPFDVSISTPSTLELLADDRSTPNACAMKIAAIDR